MKWLKDWLKRSSAIVKVYEYITLRIKKMVCRFKEIVIERPKVKHSYGEKNKDKTFFVMLAWEKSGLYSSILLALPVMEYAKRRGYIPVFDFKNSYNGMMQDEEKKGLENAWEYYYEQPSKVSLEEVYQSKRVIHYSRKAYPIPIPDWNAIFPASVQELQHWHKFIVNNIRLKKPIEERIKQETTRLFAGKEKILGVGIRAEFRASSILRNANVEGHPKVPTCEEMIRIVENKMKEWDREYIFLSVDDREYQQKFVNYFGDKCIFLERHLIHFFKNDKPTVGAERRNEYKDISVKEGVEEYIVETYLLSKCDSLYSCIGGGAQFAYFLNGGKYEHLDVYNEGLIHL